MLIAGRTAIVTGGAIRIGRALVEALITDGARVVCHFGSSSRAGEELLEQYGPQSITLIQADLNRPVEAADRIVQAAVDSFGRPSILINSAAIFEPGCLAETTEDHWDRHFNINLKSAFFLTQRFMEQRDPAQPAHVVNIIDWRGLRPRPGHLAYTLTKSALASLTRALAIELGPDVQVNAIAPGAILPPPGESEEYLRDRTRHVPLQRHGGPDDIVRAARYLLASDFVTGEVLHVTGGEQL